MPVQSSSGVLWAGMLALPHPQKATLAHLRPNTLFLILYVYVYTYVRVYLKV